MASANIVQITDANFDTEVLNSETPVLVDFWAEWCGPCRMLGPTIDELADEYKGKVKVGKVDTDANRNTAMKFSISAIPTVIVFKKGQIVQKISGLRGKRNSKRSSIPPSAPPKSKMRARKAEVQRLGLPHFCRLNGLSAIDLPPARRAHTLLAARG